MCKACRGEDWTADKRPQLSLTSHSTSPRKHRRHLMCVCVCEMLAYSGKKDFKANDCYEVGCGRNWFYSPLLTRWWLGPKDSWIWWSEFCLQRTRAHRHANLTHVHTHTRRDWFPLANIHIQPLPSHGSYHCCLPNCCIVYPVNVISHPKRHHFPWR